MKKLAILLALCLTLSALPAGMLAEEGVEETVTECAEVIIGEDAEAPAEGSAPASVEESAPAPAEQSAPASVEESAPATVEESAPASVEESAPAPAEESAPAPAEGSAPAPAEGSAPAPVEESAPEPVEESAPAPVEEGAQPSAEEAAPSAEGEGEPPAAEDAPVEAVGESGVEGVIAEPEGDAPEDPYDVMQYEQGEELDSDAALAVLQGDETVEAPVVGEALAPTPHTDPNGPQLAVNWATLGVGETLALAGTLPAGVGGGITYQSSNAAVASVGADGSVSALAPGDAIIIATAENAAYAECFITVKNAPVRWARARAPRRSRSCWAAIPASARAGIRWKARRRRSSTSTKTACCTA